MSSLRDSLNDPLDGQCSLVKCHQAKASYVRENDVIKRSLQG